VQDVGVSLDQVQPTVPNDGALIEYLRYSYYLGKGKTEPRYGAIVLSSKGRPLWISLGKANQIEHLVRRYGTLVRGSPEEDELSANLQALYETLWAPIGQVLPSQTKRHLATHGFFAKEDPTATQPDALQIGQVSSNRNSLRTRCTAAD
jgi:hypothetical protein